MGRFRHHLPKAMVAVLMILGTAAVAHFYAAETSDERFARDLQRQVSELEHQLQQVRENQGMPPEVLNQYRNSVGYIYGTFRVAFANKRPEIRSGIAGTGFLVEQDFVVTNRHVAEPWYGDSEAKNLIDRGATAKLEKLVIFFPGSSKSLRLQPPVVSKSSDLAVLHIEDSDVVRRLPVLPLAATPGSVGQFITVIGYPLGVSGMVAKSPSDIFERLAYHHDSIEMATKLARLSLIRPSTTYGHLGDVVGDNIIYDAPTAHGGSGGPVLNAKGEVIGVNAAYMDGFSGSSQGVSVESLHSLLKAAQGRH